MARGKTRRSRLKSLKARWRAKNRKKKTLVESSIQANAKAIAMLKDDVTTKYFPTELMNSYLLEQDIDSAGTFGNVAATKAVFNLTTGLEQINVATAGDNAQFYRLDRYITLKNISLHIKWEAPKTSDDDTTDPLNYCNMMVVLDSEPVKPDGTPNETNIQQILDNAGAPANSDLNLMHYQLDVIGSKQRYRVLKRKRITVGPDQRGVDQSIVSYFPQQAQNSSGTLAVRYVNINIPKHFKISYNQNNVETNQAVKLLCWTDSSERQHPKLTFISRVSFKDS